MEQNTKLPRRRTLQHSLGATAGILTTGLGCNAECITSRPFCFFGSPAGLAGPAETQG